MLGDSLLWGNFAIEKFKSNLSGKTLFCEELVVKALWIIEVCPEVIVAVGLGISFVNNGWLWKSFCRCDDELTLGKELVWLVVVGLEVDKVFKTFAELWKNTDSTWTSSSSSCDNCTTPSLVSVSLKLNRLKGHVIFSYNAHSHLDCAGLSPTITSSFAFEHAWLSKCA